MFVFGLVFILYFLKLSGTIGFCELFIQCNKDSCYEHVTGGVNMYIYMGVSVCWPQFLECAACLSLSVCAFVCLISNQSKKTLWVRPQ